MKQGSSTFLAPTQSLSRSHLNSLSVSLRPFFAVCSEAIKHSSNFSTPEHCLHFLTQTSLSVRNKMRPRVSAEVENTWPINFFVCTLGGMVKIVGYLFGH